MEKYNVLIGGRNFFDQSVSDLIKQYEEITEVSRGQGDDYTTRCLFGYAHFKDNYRLNAVDLSEQKL